MEPLPALADQTEQTTLVHNEEEAFALEPIDITGTTRRLNADVFLLSVAICTRHAWRRLQTDGLLGLCMGRLT